MPRNACSLNVRLSHDHGQCRCVQTNACVCVSVIVNVLVDVGTHTCVHMCDSMRTLLFSTAEFSFAVRTSSSRVMPRTKRDSSPVHFFNFLRQLPTTRRHFRKAARTRACFSSRMVVLCVTVRHINDARAVTAQSVAGRFTR